MAHLRRVGRTLIRQAHNINSLTRQAQCMTVLSYTEPAQPAPTEEEQPWFPATAGNYAGQVRVLPRRAGRGELSIAAWPVRRQGESVRVKGGA